MEIDSLVISLGLDPAKLREGLAQVEAAIAQGQAAIADFVQGIQEGYHEALQEVAEGGAEAASAVASAGAAAERAGAQFQAAGKRGGQGMEELGNKAQQAAQKARQAGGEVQALGRRIGGVIRGIVSRVVAPLAGALSAGAIMGSYFSDVAQMAEQTGRYSKQLEEARKKKALLARINKDDIELYRKGKLALLDFNIAMAGLSATIMRALSPAIRAGIDMLNSLADWVRRNEPNIIRFFTVLAATITATLIPSFYRLGKAMLLNPLTWIIAGILLLAIVIDDLVTYIRGGRSQFAALWSQFGTGEEILGKLRRVWESFLGAVSRFKALVPGIVTGAAAFAGYKTVIGILSAVAKGINFVKGALSALRVVAATNPLGLFLFALAMLIVYFDDIVAFFKDFRTNIGKLLTVIGEGIKNLLPDWIKDLLGVGSEGSKKADTLSKAAQSGDKEALQVFDMANTGGVGPLVAHPSNAELTRAAVPPAATVNNTKNQQVDARYTTNVYAPGSDPQAMADAFGNQMQRQNAQLSALLAEGGVRP